MKTKKKKKKKERETQFLMDNVTNLFRGKRINQQSLYGNFHYEKNSLNFYFIYFFGGGIIFLSF